MSKSKYTGEETVPVLYLDLDGTVRKGKAELGYFVNTPDQVQVFDEVPDLLARYKKLGWRIAGISNQGGIALGFMDMKTCAKAVVETQKQSGNAFDKIGVCPHHPNANDPEMAVCWCRKPKSGLVVETAMALSKMHKEIYPPHMGLFVGDMATDRTCAAGAGLRYMDAAEWREGKHLKEIL